MNACKKSVCAAWLLMFLFSYMSFGAGITSPRPGSVNVGSVQIVVDPPESEIASVEVDRAWPEIGGFWPYKTFTNIVSGNIFVLDEDEVTCGEYQVIVTLTDGCVLYSGLFIVYTPTPLMQVWLPDQYSRAAPGDLVLIMWDYFGYRFTPTSDFASVHVTGPKLPVDNNECEADLDSSLIVFGPGRVKWRVPTNCQAGLYTVIVTQTGRPDNVAVAHVYVESHPTARPQLSLSKVSDSMYRLSIGEGTFGPWALQYSPDSVHWYELPGLYRSNSQLSIVSSGKSLYLRLRRH